MDESTENSDATVSSEESPETTEPSHEEEESASETGEPTAEDDAEVALEESGEDVPLSVASFVPAALAEFDFGQITEESVSQTDIIDFSDQENEFLSSDLKQHALAFSILSGLFGFLLSAWIFLGHRAGPATEILDRRQAEGRVVRGRSHSGDSDYYGGLGHFSAPKIKPRGKIKRTREVPEWKNLTALDKIKVSKKKKKPKPKTVVAASVVENPGYRTAKARPTRIKKKRSLNDRESLSRLLYPRVDERPERSSLTSVEAAVKDSLILVPARGGTYTVGVVLDSSGKALISNLGAEMVNRVWGYNGSAYQATVLARDPQFGCALIQVRGGNFRTLPLAPAPPSRSEELVGFGPNRRDILSAWCDAGVGFGGAGFLVEGYLGRKTWGSPFFNNRGELTGMHFSSLAGAPGSGIHLACDSSAIYRLIRGYQGMGSPPYATTEREALAAIAQLAERASGRGKRGRVVAGAGLSDFELGMTSSEASKWVSSPTKSRPAPGRELWTSPAPPVQLLFVNDRLTTISSSFSGFSTPKGMSVGAAADNHSLSREFERFKLYPLLAVTPGLDLMLGSTGRVEEFVVRPKWTGN